jgi:hypothetical protein
MKKPNFYSVVVSLAFALVALTGYMGWLIYTSYFGAFETLPGAQDADRANWGVMGDYFGGTLGPILNGVTLCMLFIGLLVQRRQLAEAKSDAMEAHAQAQSDHKLLKKQSFEQTFFSWLHSYRDIVSEIKYRENSGKNAISALLAERFSTSQLANDGAAAQIASAQEIFSQYNKLIDGAHFSECDLLGRSALAAYDFAYASLVGELDIMLRTLYRLIRWIDNSDLSLEEKFDYVGIVRSQVSVNELLILFLNGLTERGRKFLPLINKYAFFDNFDAARRSESRIYDLLRNEGGIGGLKYTESAFNSDLARQLLILKR